MHLTASPCIYVAVSSHQQLFCTQQPPLPSSAFFLPVLLTIVIFPSSAAERADRERERKWVREISNTAVPWPLGLSGQTVGVIYSKVYPFHGDKMKTNQALTKWESDILKPSQSAWGVFLLSDRLFGKTDKHWTYCLTVCLSVCLFVCTSVMYARVIYRDFF